MGGVRKFLQERKVGHCVYSGVDRREATAVLQDVRCMSHWDMYDSLFEGKIVNSTTLCANHTNV